MMKPYKLVSYIGAALLLIGAVPAYAASRVQTSPMSAVKLKQEVKYFGEHSFDFFSIFKRYHPGPYWILHHAKQLHLTVAQIQQEKPLHVSMAKSTFADNSALRKAYKQYALDASVVQPSLLKIKRDIDAIGKAQTRLAWEMVPYHLKAYSLLNSTQKVLYRKLAAQ